MTESGTSFSLRRLGLVMKPEAGNPAEVEGVLNPAAVRGPDSELYLFPRLVGRGNYSRIGIARVHFDDDGDPAGVERLGIALEPDAPYERRPDGGGGCEDPRITFVEPLQRYVMAYAAFSAEGPRIALAISEDLFHWERLGLATFAPYHGLELGDVDDKDASLFPVAVPNPAGEAALAILHRPLFPGTRPEETVRHPASRPVDLQRESIWISYCPATLEDHPDRLGRFTSHHRLATPVAPWERLKIGGGTPPVLTRHGWLIIYHGVSSVSELGGDPDELRYAAGAMILDREHPREIRYRTPEPILRPSLPGERNGTIAKNIVFPTGIDRRDDLGTPDRFDIYYGMADATIGVARLDLPDRLPPGGVADSPGATV